MGMSAVTGEHVLDRILSALWWIHQSKDRSYRRLRLLYDKGYAVSISIGMLALIGAFFLGCIVGAVITIVLLFPGRQ